MLRLIISTILMSAIGMVGAWLTVRVRGGWPWWLPVMAGVASYSIWSLTARHTTVNLVALSAWFDVVVALAWFAGFWLLGHETITPTQWVGIALLCLGLGLINVK